MIKKRKVLIIGLLFLLCGALVWIITQTNQTAQKQEKLSVGQDAVHYKEYTKVLDSLEKYNKPEAIKEAENFYRVALQKQDTLWLAAAYYYKGTFKKDSTFFYLTKSRVYAQESRDTLLMGRVDYEIGKFYSAEKNYPKSIEYLLRAEEIFESTKHLNGLGHVNNILGNMYSNINEYDKAIDYYDKAIRYFKQIKDTLGVAISTTNNSKVFLAQKEYDLARTDLLKALAVFEKLGDTKKSMFALMFLSDVELHVQNLEASLNYIDQAHQKALYTNDTLWEKHILMHYGHIYESYGDYDKAIHFYEDGIEKSTGENLELEAFQRLSALWIQKNNYQKAYEYMEQYYQLNDSIRGSTVKLEMEGLQWKNRLEAQSLENQLLKQEAAIKQQKYRNRLIVAISVISVLGLLYFNNIKSSRIIKLENNSLSSKVAFEKRLNELLEKEFEEELAARARELNVINIQLLAKNQLFREVKRTLEKSSEHKTKDAMIKELWYQIDKLENQERDWEQFRVVFEQIHPNFFQTIVQEAPSLTKIEIRICAYIKINMENGEIATLLNMAHRSLITIRSRIRKKLNLERGESLEDLLKSW